MAWATGSYGRTAYGFGIGSETPPAPGAQNLPPPLPGGTRRWTYDPTPVIAWGARSWGGRQPLLSYPGGGVSVLPIPDRGVMRVAGWWPDAPVLQFLRVHRDGSMHPVRSASPLTVDQPTRRNWCGNPSCEAGRNGYVADVGSPTFSNAPDAARGAIATRATVASAGSLGVTVPSSMTGGQPITMGIDLRFSARPTSVTLQIGWADSTGTALIAATAVLSSAEVNRSVSQWSRQVATLSTPSGAVTPTVKVLVAGMPAGGWMDFDGVTLERGITDGSFFDGETPAATWTGVQHLSTSVLAPVLTFDDGECPLDVPVQYVVGNATASGGRMVSAEQTLASNNRTWLTHPADSANPYSVVVASVPDHAFGVERGVFRPLDSRYAVVVTGDSRQASSGDITFEAMSWAVRDTLVAMFKDLQPVLLRAPGDYHEDDRWLSLGELKTTANGNPAYVDHRSLTAPFDEVAPPSTSVAA